MSSDSLVISPSQNPWFRTIRPIGVYALHGIAFTGDKLMAIDSVRGHLLQIDPITDNTVILNGEQVADYIGATGLAIWEDTIWFSRDYRIYYCNFADLTPQRFITLPYPIDGLAVWQKTLYASCQKSGYIHIFDRNSARQITNFYTPGIGLENLTVTSEELWVCDSTEQTIYCLDRATGKVNFSVLTPFEFPTGLAFHHHQETNQATLYVAYGGEEPYIRDDPNSEPSQQLAWRDRTFIHPLYFHHYPQSNYALSNGYLVEMSYVEELSPLKELHLDQLEWRIALPTETDRQKVKQIEAIGRPFTEEILDGQKVAVFKFDTLKPNEQHLFGWKALLELRGIKYQITPRALENIPPLSPEFRARYLVDDDDLAMDHPSIQKAAQEAIGRETNLLRQMLSIRNYVYDQLSYGIRPQIDTPDIVLARGVGSCGEYVGLLLALTRLNGIACRTVGRYKCPAHPELRNIPLQPDFNHVWLEFYVPSIGWLPMESNPDDIQEQGPYPTRFFMGLPWNHVEIGKGIPFATLKTAGVAVNKEEISIGELAINHVRFTILAELMAN